MDVSDLFWLGVVVNDVVILGWHTFKRRDKSSLKVDAVKTAAKCSKPVVGGDIFAVLQQIRGLLVHLTR
jgi:(p)ppGpp synthase/HD superfamily hydrolase